MVMRILLGLLAAVLALVAFQFWGSTGARQLTPAGPLARGEVAADAVAPGATSERTAVVQAGGVSEVSAAPTSQTDQEVAPALDDVVELVVTLVDRSGGPVREGAVRVWPDLASPGSETPHQDGRVDDRGQVRFQVPRGVVAVNGYTTGSPAQFARGSVDCSASDRATLTLVLESARQVSGRVLESLSGQPIIGAEVLGPLSASHGFPPAVTDANGEFSVTGFPLGTIDRLNVRAHGFGQETVRVGFTSKGGWQVPARFGWPEQSGQTGDPWLEVRLVPEKVVEGDVVGDHAGLAVGVVGFYLTTGQTGHWEEASVTPEDGHFVLSGLRSDITHSVRVRDAAGASAVLRAESGLHIDLGKIRLSQPFAVTGVVQDREQRPLPGLGVRLRVEFAEELTPEFDPQDGNVLTRDGWSGQPSIESAAFTDMDGRFRLDGVLGERAELIVADRTFYDQQVPLPQLDGADIDVGLVQLDTEVGRIEIDLVALGAPSNDGPMDVQLQGTGGGPTAHFRVGQNGRAHGWWDPNWNTVDLFLFAGEPAHLVKSWRARPLTELARALD